MSARNARRSKNLKIEREQLFRRAIMKGVIGSMSGGRVVSAEEMRRYKSPTKSEIHMQGFCKAKGGNWI